VLDLIRGKEVQQALEILQFVERDAAIVVRKCLASAMANAEHNDQIDSNELYVSACFADEGPTLKRWRPRARGRATRIRKRTCHITIIVSRLSEEQLERRRRREEASPAAAGRGRRRSQALAQSRADRVAKSRARAEAAHEHDHDEHDHEHEDEVVVDDVVLDADDEVVEAEDESTDAEQADAAAVAEADAEAEDTVEPEETK
jgi:large subunit ribosomal protein L22